MWEFLVAALYVTVIGGVACTFVLRAIAAVLSFLADGGEIRR